MTGSSEFILDPDIVALLLFDKVNTVSYESNVHHTIMLGFGLG
jgi:hypothetical protein